MVVFETNVLIDGAVETFAAAVVVANTTCCWLGPKKLESIRLSFLWRLNRYGEFGIANRQNYSSSYFRRRLDSTAAHHQANLQWWRKWRPTGTEVVAGALDWTIPLEKKLVRAATILPSTGFEAAAILTINFVHRTDVFHIVG